MADDEITVTMPRVEALALKRVAEYGIRAAEAFDLIQNTSTAERGYNKLSAAVSEPAPAKRPRSK